MGEDLSQTEPMKYDDLDYTPTSGVVTVRGERDEWGVRVSVDQGRAMEEDGFEVAWTYSSIPGWAADSGLGGLWTVFYRLWTWPSRWGADR